MDVLISIHAPLRGRLELPPKYRGVAHFNPRPLAGATGFGSTGRTDFPISIHAPLRGRRDETD